ncbi:MAG: cell division protein FtsQ/DivIB [Acidimicrobiia bacterium]
MTTVEPRIAQRRRNISEDRARKRLRWILLIIAIVSLIVVAVWLVRSPFLSISTIEITNAQQSDPGSTLTRLGIEVGTPTIDVDAAAIRSAIEEDPWVASALVSVQWPGSILIEIEEHVASSPARSGSGWVMLSEDSTVLTFVDQPSTGTLTIDIDLGVVVPGDVIDDPLIVGALAFGAALRDDLRENTVIYAEDNGLFATVAARTVRLGRPVDMGAKATVLAALLDQGLDPEAAIDVIAPSRPAVLNPQPQVEPEE